MLRPMGGSDTLAQFDRWLEELARKWERYFARDPLVPLPPERERAALDRRLKEVSRSEGRTAAEQFRLDQMLHRFSTYNQLWQRMLRDHEEARAGPGSATRRPNAAASVPVPGGGDDYRETFDRYAAALGRNGAPAAVDYGRFREALQAQRRQLEGQGAVVEGFDVVEDGGAVRVRARVRRRRQE